MKYLVMLFVFVSLNGFAQSHREQIADFREKYAADFLKDKNSPLKKQDLQYLRFYHADSTYAVQAKAEIAVGVSPFLLPTFNGNGQDYVKYALLTMTIKGKPVKLTVYRNVALSKIPAYADYLFLPFTDDTNGKETYSGGRYIDLQESDFKDGKILIDFNKAYNPYCAFSAGYSCPKPPDENQLTMPIFAGEKKFGKKDVH